MGRSCPISAAINAHGAHDVIAQGIPMTPVMADAPWVEDIQNVLNMQAAKRICETSHRRLRVRTGPICGIRHDDPESVSVLVETPSFLSEEIKSGRIILAANETIAFMKSAKVPSRVASTQILSISSSGRSRYSSKIGLTYNWPM